MKQVVKKGEYWCESCDGKYRGGLETLDNTGRPSNQKRIARMLANAGKKMGKLVPMPCEMCNEKKVEMHHPDYSRPLDIVWLCASCHRHIHKKAYLL